MRTIFIVISAMISLLGYHLVHATEQTIISIDEGFSAPTPLAITPFEQTAVDDFEPADGNELPDIRSLIEQDLRIGGQFNLFPVDKMPEPLTASGALNHRLWADAGLDYVVRGTVELSSRSLRVSYQLIDTLGIKGAAGSVVLHNSFDGTRTQAHSIAHRISEELYRFIVGRSGDFTNKVAYVLQKGEHDYRLVVSNYEGSEPKTIVKSRLPLLSPRFSPDGSHIVYTVLGGIKSTLFMQDLASGTREVITEQIGYVGSPTFTPTGDVIYSVSDGNNLYISMQQQKMAHLAKSGEAVFSEDGTRVFVVSDRSGVPLIYEHNLVDNSLRRLTKQRSFSPAILPKSDELLVVSDGQLVAINRTSGEQRILVHTRFVENPRASVQGEMILYTSTQGGKEAIYGVSKDGKIRFNFYMPELGSYRFATFGSSF